MREIKRFTRPSLQRIGKIEQMLNGNLSKSVKTIAQQFN